MKDKFDKVPATEEANLLSTPELARCARSSKKLQTLFQPLLNERKLLHHVVRGEHDAVRALLKQDINLLFRKSRVTDLSFRTFVGISPCNYMLWALDENQFNAMLACFPRDEKDNEIEITAQLRSQYNDPTNQLLLQVVRGEHDMVRAFLTQDINLLYKKSSVIDLSGRVFNDISPFEYALWALDSHMWNAMLKSVPENEQGDKVLEQLGMQYMSLSQGLTYRLNGKVIKEPHFDFKNTIIRELQTQVDFFTAHGFKSLYDHDANNKRLIKGVGSAQRFLPVHVVNEYCAPTSFRPVPAFNAYPGSSKQFYNSITGRVENWFNEGSRLGIDFGIYRGMTGHSEGGRTTGTMYRPGWQLGLDLAAMTALCKVRTNDFINLATLIGIAPYSQPAFHV